MTSSSRWPLRNGSVHALRHVALVVAGALVIALSANLAIPVPGSPVPVTGQTFAVLLVGGALGYRRGMLATLLYLGLGLFLPVYAQHKSGVEVIGTIRDGHLVLGTNGGYLLGFVLAAALVGRLAELGWDRRIGGALGAMLLGNVVIYAIGLPWLMAATGHGRRLGRRERPDAVPHRRRPEAPPRRGPVPGRLVGRRPPPGRRLGRDPAPSSTRPPAESPDPHGHGCMARRLSGRAAAAAATLPPAFAATLPPAFPTWPYAPTAMSSESLPPELSTDRQEVAATPPAQPGLGQARAAARLRYDSRSRRAHFGPVGGPATCRAVRVVGRAAVAHFGGHPAQPARLRDGSRAARCTAPA